MSFQFSIQIVSSFPVKKRKKKQRLLPIEEATSSAEKKREGKATEEVDPRTPAF